MQAEPKRILLGRMEGISKEKTTTGSVVLKANCGHSCWISPAALTLLMTTPGVETMCTACFVASDIEPVWAELPGGDVQDLMDGVPLDEQKRRNAWTKMRLQMERAWREK